MAITKDILIMFSGVCPLFLCKIVKNIHLLLFMQEETENMGHLCVCVCV